MNRKIAIMLMLLLIGTALIPNALTIEPKEIIDSGFTRSDNVTACCDLTGYTQPPGLVGYWKLDEGSGTTAYDSSGYNNHGIIFGASWTSGKVNSALSFDGVDDYVDCRNDSSLMPTTAITVEAWFKANDVRYGAIASTVYYEGYGLYIEPDGSMEFFPGISWTPPETIQPGVWYHAVGTFAPTISKIYVNGQLVGSQGAGYLAYTGQRLSIGTNPTRTGWFNGTIDEVKIYNRALSAEEIWAEYTRNESVPQPQIIEPSILDPEAPRHNDTLVIWGDSINVSAIELRYAEDIENTTFEYSPNGIDWNIIGTSYLGIKEWENWTDIDGDPFNSFRTWTVAWNMSGVGEGLYYIRATMVNTAGRVGQDNITVYFDPTPPIPEFTLPWGATVNGTVQIEAVTNATDILYTQFESLKVSTDYPVKPVMTKAKCPWNAIAALLMYWASLPSKEYPQDTPHKNLIQNDAGNDMSEDALIDAIIDYYNTKNGLKGTKNAYNRNKGLTPDDERCILQEWLNKKGFKGSPNWLQNRPEKDKITVQQIKREFEQQWGGPMMLGIVKYPFGPESSPAHAMVLKSFENKPDENGDYTVDFADSAATATKGVRVTKMGPVAGHDLYIEMKFGSNGKKDERDGWWFVDSKLQIIPDDWDDLDLERKPPCKDWWPEDIDYMGTKKWYCALNTTQLEEGYYFIKATMVDSSGNNGTEITEVLVDNIPPIPGDHDLAITNLFADKNSINVTVENLGLGRYNETAYVSISSRYVWSMTGVDLVSGANETITFEWSPSPGLYNITAEVDSVLDEVNTADNTLSTIYARIVGDMNDDSKVDILDAILLSLSYGKHEGQEGYNPDTNLKTGDATPEEINILDAIILAAHFNEHYP